MNRAKADAVRTSQSSEVFCRDWERLCIWDFGGLDVEGVVMVRSNRDRELERDRIEGVCGNEREAI